MRALLELGTLRPELRVSINASQLPLASISMALLQQNFTTLQNLKRIIFVPQATIVQLDQPPLLPILLLTVVTPEWVENALEENIALLVLQFQLSVLLVHTVILMLCLRLKMNVMLVVIALREQKTLPSNQVMTQITAVLQDITVNKDLVSLCLAWVVPTTIRLRHKTEPLVLMFHSAGGQQGLPSITFLQPQELTITMEFSKPVELNTVCACRVSTALPEALTLTPSFAQRATSVQVTHTTILKWAEYPHLPTTI
jgi:hypothetical protein